MNKLSLPATIIVASLILGGFYYVSEANKQKAISNQAEVNKELIASKNKEDHLADRRKECLDIYKQESNKWNNTESFEYDQIDDVCYIQYKDTSAIKGRDCSFLLPDDKDDVFTRKLKMREWKNCIEGTTERNF